MSWQKVTKSECADMLLQISVYGKLTEIKRFKSLSFESKQKVVHILKTRAKRHRRDGENPYDYWVLKEVIEDAVRGIFVDANDDGKLSL